jgi:hypothetical protein
MRGDMDVGNLWELINYLIHFLVLILLFELYTLVPK